uniref:Reverse transcriptase Ty1/copia-type domain-containing protein n=1 Tax=Pseudo-nitzschia australis TaxID=44445 RepID=A0A7S4AMN0_9STRA
MACTVWEDFWNWSEFYPGAKEVVPSDAPKALGIPVTMACFVDADFAGCKATRRLHTGVIIYLNNAPIIWFSKRQTTVETSTFGSEIVAMRIAIELVEGLRYKLRMMGVPINGSTNMYCDNESVVTNVTRPESPCKKKHNSVAYHKARESIAAQTIRIAKEPGDSNPADLMTKLMGGEVFRNHFKRCMW